MVKCWKSRSSLPKLDTGIQSRVALYSAKDRPASALQVGEPIDHMDRGLVWFLELESHTATSGEAVYEEDTCRVVVGDCASGL